MSFAAVILAAGQGTRMKSDLPKVLHTVNDRPMVSLVIDTVKAADPAQIIVVIGYKADLVREACKDDGVTFALQEEQLGTGHAVMQARDALNGFDGTVVVLNGDVPCLRTNTLESFLGYHARRGASATVLTARMEDPTGYGRIVRDGDGSLLKIVEHKDATDDERAIDEINSGLFCFDAKALFSALERTGRDNAQNEYYLTDAIETIRTGGGRVEAWCVDDNWEVAGVNTEAELQAVREYLGRDQR